MAHCTKIFYLMRIIKSVARNLICATLFASYISTCEIRYHIAIQYQIWLGFVHNKMAVASLVTAN